jgi:cardiolipin synthase A/B
MGITAIGRLPPFTLSERAARVERVPQKPSLAPAYPKTLRNNVEVLVDGGQFFPRMLADLRSASSSIHIAQYGFKDGKIGREVAEILCAKARSGVEVRVVVDRRGTQLGNEATAALFKKMTDAGVQVVTSDGRRLLDRDGLEGAPKRLDLSFDELNKLDHRKLYVIDGKTAYLGGMGLEDHFVDKLHDVMVRTEGESVAQLQRSFLSSFKFLGGALPTETAKLAKYYPAPVATKSQVSTQILGNAPGTAMRVTAAYHREIDGAKRTLDVMNPYFGDDTITDKLCAAAKRGVRVRLVVNKDAENAFSSAAQRHEYGKLIAAGVEVYEYPGTLHAKLLVADGQRALVGSCNLDSLSLRRNFELNALFDDEKVAREFTERIFEKDLPQCARAVPEKNPARRVWNALIDKLDYLW